VAAHAAPHAHTPAALELLASPEFDSRVESVFVIGGGQVGVFEVPGQGQ
jgi:hypothetical protein